VGFEKGTWWFGFPAQEYSSWEGVQLKLADIFGMELTIQKRHRGIAGGDAGGNLEEDAP